MYEYRAYVSKVYDGDTSAGTLLRIDKSQWVAGIDPMFDTVSSAANSYAAGQGTCTQNVLYREWEAAIRNTGNLRTLSQKMTKEFFLTAIGLISLCHLLCFCSSFILEIFSIFFSPPKKNST